MKDLFKKISVLLVAVFMAATLCATRNVSAEINRPEDDAMLKISGFDGGERVTMYKLYKANYEETDAETKDKQINSYTFTNNDLVDGKDIIELAPAVEYTQAEYDAYVQENGSNPSWSVGDVKTEAVQVKIEELTVGSDGKIVADQTVGGNEYDLSTITEKVYPNKSDSTLKISDLVGKYPFSTDKPKEAQINAISAAIASGTLAIPKVNFVIKDGTGNKTQDYLDVPSSASELDIMAYAKKDPASGDQFVQAMFDATGIFLAKVEPAEGEDTVYNPAIVSVGYIHNEQDGIVYSSEGYSMANGYRYDTNSPTVKKSKPDVKKTVNGGMVENNVDEPVVALDLDGNPLNYDGNPDSLTYILKDKTQQDVIDALNNGTDLSACTTTDVDQALTKEELIHSGSEGTKFTYTVSPTLPSYPVNAVNKTLWFSDTMSSGLDYVEGSLEVVLKNSEITKVYNSTDKKYEFFVNNNKGIYGYYLDNGQWKAADATHPATHSLLATAVDIANGFNITFDYDAIPGGKDADLKLNYDAVIKTEEAIVGLHGMPNVVTMVYANKPDEGNTHDVKDTDKPQGDGLREIEDYEIVYTYELYFKKVDDQGRPLKDAIFGLYAAENIYYQDGENNADGTLLYEAGQLVCTIKTNDDGIGYTTEVGPGNYYLKEIKAPKDFQLNSTQYPVTVNWTKATKKVSVTHETWEYTTEQPDTAPYSAQVGWLIGTATDGNFYQLADYPLSEWTYDSTEHTLTRGNDVIENAYAAYVDPDTHVISTQFTEEDMTNPDVNTNNNGWVLLDSPIPNTKTPELPSTGGIGTYMFTIAGVAILATAAFMLIFRKKENV